MELVDVLTERIRERGPMTVAAFMDAALYHPELGYYARASQRSGRAGDFFTSVDVGPLFGELLAVQIAEMANLLGGRFDLVEAGAGNGRLSADILRALRDRHAGVSSRTTLHLVEASPTARQAQRDVLDNVAGQLASSSDHLPDSIEGVVVANELLDAMPVHQVVMRDDGLREIYVAGGPEGLTLTEGPLSTPRLEAYFRELDITLESGWRTEVSLAAIDWMTNLAARLTRGFAILIDYGHEAGELFSVTHSAGTLTSYSRHAASGPEAGAPTWLNAPGHHDLTAHVDFTSVMRAAARGGCTALGLMDQMYFVMALAAERLASLDLKERLAFKTLLMPGGLGTTMKVLILGKNVGTPALTGVPAKVRVS